MPSTEILWNEFQSDDPILGLEAFISDDIALDVISYDGIEWSWMIREWVDDADCEITASYDFGIYYGTCDEALANMKTYIRENNSRLWGYFESSPVKHSFSGFCQKALKLGMSISLAAAMVCGMVGCSAGNGHVEIPESGSYSIESFAEYAASDYKILSGREVVPGDELMEYFTQFDEKYSGSLCYELDADSEYDVANLFADGYETSDGIAYRVFDDEGYESVMLVFADGSRILSDCPELITMMQQNVEGTAGMSFSSLRISPKFFAYAPAAELMIDDETSAAYEFGDFVEAEYIEDETYDGDPRLFLFFRIGNAAISSDGSFYVKVGNTIVGSGGVSYFKAGNNYVGTDGSLSVPIGSHMYYNSNGQIMYHSGGAGYLD